MNALDRSMFPPISGQQRAARSRTVGPTRGRMMTGTRRRSLCSPHCSSSFLEETMPRNTMHRTVRLGPPLLLLLASLAGCSDAAVTAPRLARPHKSDIVGFFCDENNPDCTVGEIDMDGFYSPQLPPLSDYMEVTAQNDFVNTWMNSAEFRDTMPGVVVTGYQPGELDCLSAGYGNSFNGSIDGDCPSAPCYEQWKNMRDAGGSWAVLTYGMSFGFINARNAWGLFSVGAPGSMAATIAWGKILDSRKKYIMCMSQDNNWYFYHPAEYADRWRYQYGAPPRPRYPNGMPR
jgi:hypothetical protein